MAAQRLDVLRDKLHARADGELRARIEERLEPLRKLTRNAPTLDIPAGTYTVAELITRIANQAFDDRVDQARGKVIDAFLERVERLEG